MKQKYMFYGAAFGDAIGTPFEFRMTPEKIKETYTGKIDRVVKVKHQFQPLLVLPIGQFSDDTGMALALLSALLENDMVYDEKKALLAYLKWANDKQNTTSKFIGNNTRALFRGITTARGYSSRMVKVKSNSNDGESLQSNGALMRCYPLALVQTQMNDVHL